MKKVDFNKKIKNSFQVEQKIKKEQQKIIKQDMQTVLIHKMRDVVDIYQRGIQENGYSEALSYRVIILCLINKNPQNIKNSPNQIELFFQKCLQNVNLLKIRLCFELLLMKQLIQVFSIEEIVHLKIRSLQGLRIYYQISRNKGQQQKCSYTIQQYCRQTLQKDNTKRKKQIYSNILDILIEQEKIIISCLISKKKQIQAVQALSNFINFLQKSQETSSKKYQIQLMEAYWTISILHDQLHYYAYTKKYAQIAFNIAKRIQQTQVMKQIQKMIQKLD